MLPKKYSSNHTITGFKINSLEEINYAQDTPRIYIETQESDESLIDALPQFFLTHNDQNFESRLEWNIVISGHGGSTYQEINNGETITWTGQPWIANLSVTEFNQLLIFFHTKVKTHFLHYSSCYAGGNHAQLIFQDEPNKTYNFPIICGALTDCGNYCKWLTLLPSESKKFLTSEDLSYDSTNGWQLILKPEYQWNIFFNEIGKIDFSTASIEYLPKILSSITYHSISDIPLLCSPNTTIFFPLHQSNVLKIDPELLKIADESLTIQGIKTFLIESTNIEHTLVIDTCEKPRFISIKAGNAIHYFKKLKAIFYLDLPSVFWQAEYQARNKLFLIDECVFPNSLNSHIFKNVNHSEELVLKNVIISQQKNFSIRIFFTLDDTTMMVAAHKPSEENEVATIQEIATLSQDAKIKYEHYYTKMKSEVLK